LYSAYYIVKQKKSEAVYASSTFPFLTSEAIPGEQHGSSILEKLVRREWLNHYYST